MKNTLTNKKPFEADEFFTQAQKDRLDELTPKLKGIMPESEVKEILALVELELIATMKRAKARKYLDNQG